MIIKQKPLYSKSFEALHGRSGEAGSNLMRGSLLRTLGQIIKNYGYYIALMLAFLAGLYLGLHWSMLGIREAFILGDASLANPPNNTNINTSNTDIQVSKSKETSSKAPKEKKTKNTQNKSLQ